MTRILRLLRGATGTALTWGIAWAIVGTVLAIATHSERGFRINLVILTWFATCWATLGACAGLIYALSLANDGRNSLAELAFKRVTILGAIAGVFLPLTIVAGASVAKSNLHMFSGSFLRMIVEFAATGAGCAAASVALALQARDDDRHPDSRQLRRSKFTPRRRWIRKTWVCSVRS